MSEKESGVTEIEAARISSLKAQFEGLMRNEDQPLYLNKLLHTTNGILDTIAAKRRDYVWYTENPLTDDAHWRALQAEVLRIMNSSLEPKEDVKAYSRNIQTVRSSPGFQPEQDIVEARRFTTNVPGIVICKEERFTPISPLLPHSVSLSVQRES